MSDVQKMEATASAVASVKNRVIVYRCPNCEKSLSLWRGVMVEGWVGIDEDGQRNGDRYVDWANIDLEFNGGCGECGWEGDFSRISVTLGIDGAPLPEIHRGQLAVALDTGGSAASEEVPS